jgi:hypothetical protein
MKSYLNKEYIYREIAFPAHLDQSAGHLAIIFRYSFRNKSEI